jgi:hypothetical protein
MPEVTINYLAVVVAAVYSMALGFIWYSNALFGKEWAKMVGLSEADQKKGATMAIAFSALGALVLAYVMATFLDFATAETVSEALQVGFWVWLGFVVTTMGMNHMFEQRRKKLLAMNIGYQLINILGVAIILTYWA